MTSTSRRAFTLIEVLVSASLAVLVIGMMVSFLVPTMRASVRGSVRVEMQQQAVVAIGEMAADLERTAASGVSVSVPASPLTSPVIIGIVRISDVLSSGQQVWEQQVIVYSWQGPGNPLVRKIWQPGKAPSLSVTLNGSSPVRLADADLKAIASEPTLTSQIMAIGVQVFGVSHNGVPVTNVVPPVRLTLQLQRQEATGRQTPESFQFSRSVALRNSI